MNNKKFFQRRFINISLTIFLGLALSITFFFAIYNARDLNLGFGKLIGALRPFIYGAIIAYLLIPVCNFFERNCINLLTKTKLSTKSVQKIASVSSIILSFLFAFLIIYILLSLIIPQFIVSLSTIVDNFDWYYANITNWVNDFFKNNKLLHDYAETITKSISSTAEKWLQTELLPNAKTLVSNVSTGVLGAFSIIKNLFIGIIVSIYFLISRKNFAAQARIFTHAVFKEKIAGKIIDEVNFTNKMFMGFISGRLLDSTIIGCLCFIGFTILKIPYPLLISVIVGVTNVIPFFGPFIGGIPAGFIILMASPVKCLWFVIFIVILQQIDGNIIGPKIVGEKTNLNSFWVLFAIMLFSGLFGFAGMIVGVPVFAVIYHLVQELVMLGLKRTGYQATPEEAEASLLNEYLAKHPQETAANIQPVPAGNEQTTQTTQNTSVDNTSMDSKDK